VIAGAGVLLLVLDRSTAYRSIRRVSAAKKSDRRRA